MVCSVFEEEEGWDSDPRELDLSDLYRATRLAFLCTYGGTFCVPGVREEEMCHLSSKDGIALVLATEECEDLDEDSLCLFVVNSLSDVSVELTKWFSPGGKYYKAGYRLVTAKQEQLYHEGKYDLSQTVVREKTRKLIDVSARIMKRIAPKQGGDSFSEPPAKRQKTAGAGAEGGKCSCQCGREFINEGARSSHLNSSTKCPYAKKTRKMSKNKPGKMKRKGKKGGA